MRRYVPALFQRPAVFWGTTIVLLTLLVNLVHVAAHLNLHIYLNPADTAYVIIVIGLCPLVAMGLLFRLSQVRTGLCLLALAMAGSLLFGVYQHFIAAGPDHVGSQVIGPWATTFVVSAYALIAAEAAGTCIGVYFLLQRG